MYPYTYALKDKVLISNPKANEALKQCTLLYAVLFCESASCTNEKDKKRPEDLHQTLENGLSITNHYILIKMSNTSCEVIDNCNLPITKTTKNVIKALRNQCVNFTAKDVDIDLSTKQLIEWKNFQCSFYAYYFFFCEMEQCFNRNCNGDYKSFRTWLEYQMTNYVRDLKQHKKNNAIEGCVVIAEPSLTQSTRIASNRSNNQTSLTQSIRNKANTINQNGKAIKKNKKDKSFYKPKRGKKCVSSSVLL